MNIWKLIDDAAGINTNYRGVDGVGDKDLETGFLYGTAEMIIAINGLPDNISYSDYREKIAREIDCRAVREGALYYLTKPS